MKISFGITTHDEGLYLNTLVSRLRRFMHSPAVLRGDTKYEIVIVDDYSRDPLALSTFSEMNLKMPPEYGRVYLRALGDDFAAQKNFLTDCCRGDWILQLDADEYVPDDFLFSLPSFIESNPGVEAFWLPRVNTVDGLTLAHVREWRWVITSMDGFRRAAAVDPASGEYELLRQYGLIVSEENGYVTYDQPIVCWPDPQMRLYRRCPAIRWEGRVHERLTGFANYTSFPFEPQFAIRHHKEIRRQEVQNAYYATLSRQGADR